MRDDTFARNKFRRTLDDIAGCRSARDPRYVAVLPVLAFGSSWRRARSDFSDVFNLSPAPSGWQPRQIRGTNRVCPDLRIIKYHIRGDCVPFGFLRILLPMSATDAIKKSGSS